MQNTLDDGTQAALLFVHIEQNVLERALIWYGIGSLEFSNWYPKNTKFNESRKKKKKMKMTTMMMKIRTEITAFVPHLKIYSITK